MTAPKLDLGPYWVDRLTPADHAPEQPELPRPRRRSDNHEAMQESRRRGGQRGRRPSTK